MTLLTEDTHRGHRREQGPLPGDLLLPPGESYQGTWHFTQILNPIFHSVKQAPCVPPLTLVLWENLQRRRAD